MNRSLLLLAGHETTVSLLPSAVRAAYRADDGQGIQALHFPRPPFPEYTSKSLC